LKHKGRELNSFTVKRETNKNKWKIMVGKLAPCFKKTWELNLTCSIFKPNASLTKALESIGRLRKGLTNVVGRPGNSLERNYHYSIENYFNFIAERISNIDVGFVKLFERHDKPWMNERVRNVNLQLN
jgi:hypothetical protein